jgi:hypothetical protein
MLMLRIKIEPEGIPGRPDRPLGGEAPPWG